MAQGILSIKIRADASGLERALKIAGRDMAAFSQKALAIGRGITLGFTAPVVAMGTGFLNAAASMDQLERGLTAMMGSTAEASKELSKLKESAKLPGLAFEEAVRGSIRLQSVGLQADQARKVLETFGKAISTTGGGAVELEAVQYQLTQMISKNKILAEDFKPIQSAVPLIGQAMQKAFGTDNIEGIRELGIGAKEFTMRLTESLKTLPQVQNATGGVRNSFDNFKDSLKFAQAEIGKVILKNIDLESIIDNVVDSVTRLTEWFAGLSERQVQLILNTTKNIAIFGGLSWIIGQLGSSFGNLTYLIGQAVSKIVGFNKVTQALSITTTGYIAIGITLAAGIYGLYNAYKLANGPIETFNNYLSVGAKNANKEATEFNSLMTVLKDANISSSSRITIINELNTKYSEYLPNLLTEKTTIEDINIAQKEGNDLLITKFRLLKQQGIQEKQLKKIIDLQDELTELEILSSKKTFALQQQQGIGTSLGSSAAGAKDAESLRIQKIKEQLEILNKEYNKTTDSIGKLTLEQTKHNDVIRQKKIAELTFEIINLETEIDKSTKKYGANSEEVIKLNTTLGELEGKLNALVPSAENSGNAILNNGNKTTEVLTAYELLKKQLSDIEEKYKNILITQGENSTSADILRQRYYEVAGELKKINDEYDKLENRKIILNPLPEYNKKDTEFGEIFTPDLVKRLENIGNVSFKKSTEIVGIIDGVTKSTRELGNAYQGLMGISEVGNIVGKNLSPMTEAMSNAEFVMQSFKGTMSEALGSAVSAFTEMALAGETNFGKLAFAAINAARQVIAANIKVGVTELVKNTLAGPTGKLGPAALAIAGAAGLGASILFNTLINKIVPPKLAKGGLAFGPTMATVGDNPNASFDPEVIAPLSKLKNMLGDVGSVGVLETRISGNDLVILLNRSQKGLNRIK